jgi:hypothetical protein
MRAQRMGHRRTFAIAVAFIVLAGAFGTYTPALSETTIGEVSQDTQTVSFTSSVVAVCYRNDGEKLVRVVSAEDECGEHETFVQLSPGERGSEGPQGPSGDGAPSSRWYADRDGDGYGDWYDRIDSSAKPDGFVDNNGDCNDNRADVNPATGKNDGRGQDFDCDGLANETAIVWYRDRDGDGIGSERPSGLGEPPATLTNQTGKPKGGYSIYPHDCDDNNRSVGAGDCHRPASDRDDDGHRIIGNGDDCNDFENAVFGHLGFEIPYDGLDNDCQPHTLDVEPFEPDVGRHDPERWGRVTPPTCEAVAGRCVPHTEWRYR